VRCDTGIEGWSTGGEIGWLSGAPLRLLKLHGSIDWLAEERISIGELPLQRIRNVEDETEKVGRRPAVVFGEAGKLRSEGPFLELLLAWSADLKSVDNLLVVGYSFRDSHVNELIARWFNAESHRRIILIDPSGPAADDHRAFGWHLRQLNNRPQEGVAGNRYEHLVGTTRDMLAQSVALASNPIGAPLT
jgi:SIR2-like domain